MPPPLDWIELTDFSPGIWSNNNLAGGLNVTSTNLALASPTNTYRCRALPTGGLGPLPRMKESFALTTPPTDGGAPLSDTYIINGLGTWGQAIADTNANTNADHRIEVHLLLSWTYGSNDHAAAWIREHIYETVSPFTETIYSDTAAAATALQYQYAYFLKTRMNAPADVADPGELVMVCIYTPPSQDLFINRVAPDPATPTTSSTIELMNGDSEIFRKAVAHQGRVVIGRFAIYGRGVDTTNSANENVIYTDVNTYITSLTEAQVYVPEIDQNITDMASMSANQLIVVKDLGGGYVLTGDLDDVTVVRLPNLMSPDGTTTVSGTQTPRGWVYSAGDRGLYIWNGGDQSEPLSTQIDARAFTADLEGENAGHAGSCDRWLDLLLVPNLYVCDLEARSWWRLDNPDDYPTPMAFYSSAKYRGQMISARQSLIDPPADESDGTDKAFYLWEYNDLAHSYSWQSHPIWVSRDQMMQVRQGVIALQGAGQVVVTVVDVNDDANFSRQVIDVDTDVIRNYRFDVGLTAENLAIRLQSDGDANGNDGVAPLIHRLFLGWTPRQHLANANNA